MDTAKFGMRSPWMLHSRKLWAMFRHDEEVETEIDEKSQRFIIRVKSAKKADALSRIIPQEIEFGNVVFRNSIIPANDIGDVLPEGAPLIDVLRAAFDGNTAVDFMRPVSKGLFKNLVYVVCYNWVVQYEADNIADINGNVSTLYENLARDIFTKADGAFFCTSCRLGGDATSNAADKPLGDWP